MEAYGDQVGGHLGNLFSLNGKVVKPCSLRELEFYKEAYGSDEYKKFRNFLPQYFGSHDIQERNVILEDLLRHIKSPCVMDVKIGRRLYDDDATQEKRQKMEEQTLKTTSGSVGLRICGLKIQHPSSQTLIQHQKEFGRQLTADNFCQGLYTFFKNQLGDRVQPSVVSSLLDQLKKLMDVLKQTEGKFYGSSVLIYYDGQEAWNPDAQAVCYIKFIDFAHSHLKKGDGIDDGALWGLENLYKMLEQGPQ